MGITVSLALIVAIMALVGWAAKCIQRKLLLNHDQNSVVCRSVLELRNDELEQRIRERGNPQPDENVIIVLTAHERKVLQEMEDLLQQEG